MERTFGLHIVASDKDFYSGRGKKIVLPMKDGEICILPRHSDLMIAIVPGEMRFETADGEKRTAIVGGGFAQIINNRVTVLADSVERPEDIDLKRAEEARERAKEQLRQKQSIEEYYISRAALARAMSRLKAGGRKES
ncbi:MAG TPA: ATP synthase F1 subunit epsilon [Candidatus Lachnoclostridium pullistercoris]|uniref:ATP synthase epsilon chain n=1 Tax=Candidatus Lachnoclostridium pullistercoris TaxID=2838632 RepID=A0A9D2T8A2_9FIRM|nr:ATP synthase F1 subunit epsilon [Candidatus Lachnoclostridium pullistercoris]